MNNNLEIGGVQKSLENLLLEIGDKYDITLLVFHATDEQKKLIPENVKVITVKSPFKYFGIQNKYVKKKSERIAFLFWKVMAKIFGRSFVIKLMSLRQGKIKGFDEEKAGDRFSSERRCLVQTAEDLLAFVASEPRERKAKAD